jgi:cell division protease FtsH
LVEREVIFADDLEQIFGKRAWTSRTEELFQENKKLNETQLPSEEEEKAEENVVEE